MVTEVGIIASTIDAERADLTRLREVAGRVVGSVFFGTMLRTMRESGHKPAYGHGGRGEEVFAAQLHNLLAERMAAAKGTDWGEELYRRLEKHQRLISAQRAARAARAEGAT